MNCSEVFSFTSDSGVCATGMCYETLAQSSLASHTVCTLSHTAGLSKRTTEVHFSVCCFPNSSRTLSKELL